MHEPFRNCVLQRGSGACSIGHVDTLSRLYWTARPIAVHPARFVGHAGARRVLRSWTRVGTCASLCADWSPWIERARSRRDSGVRGNGAGSLAWRIRSTEGSPQFIHLQVCVRSHPVLLRDRQRTFGVEIADAPSGRHAPPQGIPELPRDCVDEVKLRALWTQTSRTYFPMPARWRR